jgi:hypothetical protein
MGHKAKIAKREFGSIGKIEEEFLELMDAWEQNNRIMTLIELSDLVGAIQGFLENQFAYTVNLNDVLKMKEATRSAFLSGERK